MATLDVTRAYSDGEVLTEAQLDSIRQDIENFFNAVKIDNENIQNNGLTGSTVLINGSVTSAKFQDDAVLTAKIADSAVTTAKIIDEAVTSLKVEAETVTAAKIDALFLPVEEGSIRLFHSFNSTVDVPRGWMICNGDVVNETNYEAIHGAGTYTDDGIASSNLLSLNLPNLANRFAVGGATTTEDGSSAIATEGNANNQIDLSHTHNVGAHTHNQELSGQAVVAASSFPGFQTATQSTDFDTDSQLSATQSIQPEAVDFLHIIRVI